MSFVYFLYLFTVFYAGICCYIFVQSYRVIHIVISLHNLNELHAKCCMHWCFWGNFRPLFDTYWALSQSIISSDQRAHQTVIFAGCDGLSSITWRFSEPQILQFCSKDCHPSSITIFVVGIDNFYALCDSYTINFGQCQTFRLKRKKLVSLLSLTDVELHSHNFETANCKCDILMIK